jgi:hypothetical protein
MSEVKTMINYTELYASLAIMWKGMAGLFVVCGFIMLLIMLISKIIAHTGKSDNSR